MDASGAPGQRPEVKTRCTGRRGAVAAMYGSSMRARARHFIRKPDGFPGRADKKF